MDFIKISGSGNDFIITDNRKDTITRKKAAAVKLCNRKTGIGADGLLLLEKSRRADFKMRIFNPDGSEAEMCGNGLRCIIRFAYERGILQSKAVRVETKAGILEGKVSGRSITVQMKITGTPALNLDIPLGNRKLRGHHINTGVPHTVIQVPDIDRVDVPIDGKAVRYHPLFNPTGTNVDWIEPTEDGDLNIRTYERGVEDETLSCGTGTVAGAIIGFLTGAVTPPVTVIARSGEKLQVCFDRHLDNIFLRGKTTVMFTGRWSGE